MVVKKQFLALCLLVSGFTLCAQSDVIQHIAARKVFSLNGNWNYIIDPYEMGFYDYRREPFENTNSGKGGFYDDRVQLDKTELIEYNFDLSPVLQVPGDWNSQAEKLSLYEGNIWYRRKFRLSPNPGSRYILYFGAVNYEAHVYLNGKKLGVHKGGFTPFEFEVTDRVAEGENVVVLKVDNIRKQDEIPTVNTDWWNYGGITRDVFLAELPPHYVRDYSIQLAKDDQETIVGHVQLSDSLAGLEITVEIDEVGLRETMTTDGQGKATFGKKVKKLELWSPESAKLYEVKISFADEQLTDRIGFRTIATQGQDILLNGKPIFLRGISIHDENPLIPGRLRTAGDMRMLLQWAKELNCNYVRLAHYPHNEKMVRLADEMGLLVWAEVPVYWTISWENPDTYQLASRQLRSLMERDKNRASVIVWSVGNETPLSDARLRFMSNLVAEAKERDNTRLVAAALEVHREGNTVIVDDLLGERIDLVSFNQYAGWYWGGTPSEITQYKFNIKYDKPVVISEFGADALAGFHGDENTRWSEEYQEALYKNQLVMLSSIPALRGMTPWILVDFRSPRRQHPYFQDFWNRKGLYSSWGDKKKAFYVLKAFYDEKEREYR